MNQNLFFVIRNTISALLDAALPIIALMRLNYLLYNILKAADRSHSRLKKPSSPDGNVPQRIVRESTSCDISPSVCDSRSDSNYQTNREQYIRRSKSRNATLMLVIIVTKCLFVEIPLLFFGRPLSIFYHLCKLLELDHFLHCKLGLTLEKIEKIFSIASISELFFTLISSSLNFLIFYMMSSRFRHKLHSLMSLHPSRSKEYAL